MGRQDDINDARKTRTSVYLTQRNRRRLAAIPRGEKTALINAALEKALDQADAKSQRYKEFLAAVRSFDRVVPTKPSEALLRELREERSKLRP